MATVAQWVSGARPRTLFVSLSPVIAGTAAAFALGGAQYGHALLALVVALGLQIGSNYANDYSDGVRGTDEVRVGPVRLVGQCLAQPRQVKAAAFASFAVAAIAGLALVVLSRTWWLLPAGVVCVGAAWFYTGGRRPYGYSGLGEVSVFVFFGVVATVGTTYTQAGRVALIAWLSSIGVGAFACAILVANNLRDIPTDIENEKRTLAVRLGARRTRALYVALLAAALVALLGIAIDRPWTLLALVAFVAAWPLALLILRGAQGRDLIPVLGRTGQVQLIYAIGIALGVWLGER